MSLALLQEKIFDWHALVQDLGRRLGTCLNITLSLKCTAVCTNILLKTRQSCKICHQSLLTIYVAEEFWKVARSTDKVAKLATSQQCKVTIHLNVIYRWFTFNELFTTWTHEINKRISEMFHLAWIIGIILSIFNWFICVYFLLAFPPFILTCLSVERQCGKEENHMERAMQHGALQALQFASLKSVYIYSLSW